MVILLLLETIATVVNKRMLKKELRSSAEPAAPLDKDVPCGDKRYCKEMTSCDEAKFYLSQCELSPLDGDADGVPCEKLCKR